SLKLVNVEISIIDISCILLEGASGAWPADFAAYVPDRQPLYAAATCDDRVSFLWRDAEKRGGLLWTSRKPRTMEPASLRRSDPMKPRSLSRNSPNNTRSRLNSPRNNWARSWISGMRWIRACRLKSHFTLASERRGT